MKTLPSKIKIFDSIYMIKYYDDSKKIDKDGLTWGKTYHWKKIIKIYKGNLPINDIWQILWHELIHVIADKLKMTDLDSDENTIDMLAMSINSIIIDNNIKNS